MRATKHLHYRKQEEQKTVSLDELISNYESLSEIDKIIIQTLSVAYIPLDSSTLKMCLQKADIQINGIKILEYPEYKDKLYLKRHISNLFRNGLIEEIDLDFLIVNKQIIEIVTRDIVLENKLKRYVKGVLFALNLEDFFTIKKLKEKVLFVIIRILFYEKKFKELKRFYIKHKKEIYSYESLEALLGGIVFNPFDPLWVNYLPLDDFEALFIRPLTRDFISFETQNERFDYIEKQVLSNSDRCTEPLECIALEKLMITGKRKEIERWLVKHKKDNTVNGLCIKGWLAFMDGNDLDSLKYYETAYMLFRKGNKNNKIFFNNFMGIFFILALLRENSDESFKEADNYLDLASDRKNPFGGIYRLLRYPLYILTRDYEAARSGYANVIDSVRRWKEDNIFVDMFFQLFVLYWIDQGRMNKHWGYIKWLYEIKKLDDYTWIKQELAGLLNDLSGVKRYMPESNCLQNVLKYKNIWEYTLNALIALKDRDIEEKALPFKKSAIRMIWVIEYKEGDFFKINPFEQKQKLDGTWTKGRAVSLKRLHIDLKSFESLTPQDLKICSHLKFNNYKDGWNYNNDEYSFNDGFLIDLIGHPLIFLDDRTTRVEILSGKPELRIKDNGDGYFLMTLFPKQSKFNKSDFIAVQETETLIKIVKLDSRYKSIAEILGASIKIPFDAEDKIREVIESFASIITINSDISGQGDTLSEVVADTKIHVHLTPVADGLKVYFFVRPFGDSGPYYLPGIGGKNIIAQVMDRQLQTVRDLENEKKNGAKLIEACPILQSHEEDQWEWGIYETSRCLEFLSEIDAVRDLAVLKWPEGESIKLKGRVSLESFHIRIVKENDWFAAYGGLFIDDSLVLDMQKILEFAEKSEARFIEMTEGEFIALTEELHKRLKELSRYSSKHGKEIRFHPLAAFALDEFINSAGHVETDDALKSHLKKLHQAREIRPVLPLTLKARLRDYQKEGFNWLSCLSNWGVGACLADDMGLGKTLQALALLLQHAADGPSLVVAPTSVCINWIAEAKRFAPTLNIIEFRDADRKKIIKKAGKFDVILCSYGLLQQKEAGKMLTSVKWQMAVLDEAQAIKNFFTKRSKAAMKLNAKFKLITTGTPIENSLGELWNLFNFINPGLLGSLENFNKKFSIPIEKNKDPQAKQHLKKLIQPFILRRTKDQVIEELPPKTEIILTVELSKQEVAFYEALRQNAIKNLYETKDDKRGQQHLKILAEITKLRLACCSSVLVNEDIALPSSKMAMFGQILQELLENRHKVLVFSQFVVHLSLLCSYLEQEDISYQYLDGRTRPRQREAAVNAFQAGEGDVFLISLKAGGTGLNLTAADYVIHMDPWWNPAVEDQASNRAHRIGQNRPVTIYRLVAKNTIEEKIVQMHEKKRDLADSLLKGSDISGKISSKELLDLIISS